MADTIPGKPHLFPSWFNTLSAEQVEQGPAKQTTIGPLLESVPRKPTFLRFPCNHMGDSKGKHDTIAAFLYRPAPCIIDNTDYKFDETYVLTSARQLAARASVADCFG